MNQKRFYTEYKYIANDVFLNAKKLKIIMDNLNTLIYDVILDIFEFNGIVESISNEKYLISEITTYIDN